MIQKSIRLKHEPSSEPLHISAKQFFVSANPGTGVLLLLSHLVDSLAFVPVMVGTLQFFFEVSTPNRISCGAVYFA